MVGVSCEVEVGVVGFGFGQGLESLGVVEAVLGNSSGVAVDSEEFGVGPDAEVWEYVGADMGEKFVI